MSSSIVRLLREDYAPDSSTPMLRDNSHASNFSTASPRISEYEPEDLEDGIGGGGATRENDFNSHSINSGRKKRFCRSFSRRSCTFMILLVMFSIVLVGSLSSKRGKDGMRDFRSRLGLSDERSAAVYDELKRYSWAKSAISTMEEEDADGKVNMSKEAGFDKRLVLNYAEPQKSMAMQLKDGVRYTTTIAYGGHANQFIAILKLLYVAQITSRVAIIPTLLPLHFDSLPKDFSEFYSLPRLYQSTQIPLIEQSDIKLAPSSATQANAKEIIPCWSVQELTGGIANLNTASMDMYGLQVQHWGLPPTLARGWGGSDLAYDALKVFDFNQWEKIQWLRKSWEEYLPQTYTLPEPVEAPVVAPSNSTVSRIIQKIGIDRSQNLKAGFSPRSFQPPTDQLLCLDNTLFLGPILFSEPYPPSTIPLEPLIPGEGLSWTEIGQFTHFTPEVNSVVDRYLLHLFAATSIESIPPFISVHLRRTDFESFRGLTTLESYSQAIAVVRHRLQTRLDHPNSWRGPSLTAFKVIPGYSAKEYAVVVTTDEPSESPFLNEVRKLGWKVIDHEERMTDAVFGNAWWGMIIDAAVLARGRGFVGTDSSTFSALAGLRVK